MHSAKKVREERLEKVKREALDHEAASCTFKPAVRKCPAYVSRMASARKENVPKADGRRGEDRPGWR